MVRSEGVVLAWDSNYEVLRNGTIYSRRANKFLKFNSSHKGGYLRVFLPCVSADEPGCKYYLVHRIIAKHFLPNPGNLPLVCHKDDNPQNNSIDNLFWGTDKMNSDDKMSKNRQAKGFQLPHTKLSEREVNQIKKWIGYGATSTVLADIYEVSSSMIRRISRKERRC